MEQDTQEKLQQLMQMAMLAANSPQTTQGYGLLPSSPFEGFPAPDPEFAAPNDVFPLPLGGWG